MSIGINIAPDLMHPQVTSHLIHVCGLSQVVSLRKLCLWVVLSPAVHSEVIR